MRVGVSIQTSLPVEFDLRYTTHALVSGRSGSGKSNFLYIVCANAVRNPSVQLVGLDGGGPLFSPLPESRYRWHAGSADFEADCLAAIAVLEEVVSLMEERLEWLREEELDNVTEFSSAMPLVLFVFDEVATTFASLEVLDQHQGNRGNKKLETRARVLVGKLLAMGRKCGIRCILATQKPDLATLSGGIRENTQVSVAFANEPNTVKLVCPSAIDEELDYLADAPPGVGLLKGANGGELFKADLLPYSHYRQVCKSAMSSA